MNQNILIAFKVSLFTFLLIGFVYPFTVTEVATFLFYKRAKGSLIFNEQNKVIGSELIGQNFAHPAYFFPRPSAAGNGYDGMASGGSNLGPTSKALVIRIQQRIQTIKKDNSEPIPLDLVTASASGLDPHISPQAANWQAPRIALERNVSLERVMSLIEDSIIPPQFNFLGKPRVNVLKLNLVLDQFSGPPVMAP